MTTTKKPTTKNLHYGGDSGFPPRGRRGFGGDPRRNPRRRRPVGDPPIGLLPKELPLPRRRRRPPIQQPIGTPRIPMTPEQRKTRIEAMQRARRRYLRTTPAQRKRQRDANIRRQLERGMTSGGQRITPQMRQLFESSLRQPARDRGLNFGNPKAFGLPDMGLPPRRRRRRRRPVVPIQPRPTVEQLRRAQGPGVLEEVRQAIPEPMQRPTARRVAAKGGAITKKRIGANDFRKGGYVLSTVDNRKNKK